ncbi:hypothetical protein [Burkholderia sp. 22PA0106]|uniref:hypothetical protein n=1 Tax=Burkholderia sp. 22PA0106 TaxID=3237371 RepID=UPI0039C42A63
MSILGSAVVLIWNDVVDSARGQFYEWHNKEHIPERFALKGFMRGRRYRGADASPEWLTVYEAADLSVLTGPAYLARLNNPTPATLATVAHFRNTTRSLCRIEYSVGESSGAYAVTMRLKQDAAASGDLKGFVATRVFPGVLDRGDVVAAHLFATDLDASNVETHEAKQRGGAGDLPARVAVVECTTEDGARAAAQEMRDAGWTSIGVTCAAPQVYTLEISHLSPSL